MGKITTIFTVVILGAVLAVACGGRAEPVPVTETLPADLQSVDPVAVTREYFALIDQAETRMDLARPWDLLTNQAQCSPINKCELSYYQEIWWPFQADAEIYACSDTTTNAVLTIHPRGQPASAQDEIRIYRVELIPVENGLWIDRMQVIPQVDEGCVLAP
jgi:hypothetical protein